MTPAKKQLADVGKLAGRALDGTLLRAIGDRAAARGRAKQSRLSALRKIKTAKFKIMASSSVCLTEAEGGKQNKANGSGGASKTGEGKKQATGDPGGGDDDADGDDDVDGSYGTGTRKELREAYDALTHVIFSFLTFLPVHSNTT